MTRPWFAAASALAIAIAIVGCGSPTRVEPGVAPAVAPAAPTVAALSAPTVSAAVVPTLPSNTAATTPVPRSTAGLPPYKPVINPSDFTTEVTNKFFPLTPGTTYIYEGTRDGVPRDVEMTFTTDTKKIMGVDCIVVRDVLTSKSQLVEKTTDWYAQDKAGNVWYFGEDTAEYENGVVTSTAGTWMAGVDGALPGMIMKASPTVGDSYRQEYRPGVAEDFARILQIEASHQVPSGSYDHVVVTEDTDLLDASKLEQKFYAAGVGFLGSSGIVNGHQEELKLKSILKKGSAAGQATPQSQPTTAPQATAAPKPTQPAAPTVAPTAAPTVAPKAAPTVAPTKVPTAAPVVPTEAPAEVPTEAPAAAPTVAASSSSEITADQAAQAALRKFPGATVEKVDHEIKGGTPLYSIQLTDTDGNPHDVEVDGQSGAVLTVSND